MSVKYFKEAIRLGSIVSLNNLGYLLSTKINKQNHYKQGIHCLRVCAHYGYAEAQNNLAIVLEDCGRRRKDHEKIRKMFYLAAKQDDEYKDYSDD